MSNWWDGIGPSHPFYPYRGIEQLTGKLPPVRGERIPTDHCPKCGAGHLRIRADNTRQCRDCDTIC